MKKIRKFIVVLMAVVSMFGLTNIGAVKVQAAVTNYTMGYEGKIATAGKYQVKMNESGIYSRKGKSGSWKRIVKNSNITCFSTNGSTVYYVTSNYNYVMETGGAKVYSISVNGGKAKAIFSTKKCSIDRIYRYGNKLYVTQRKSKFGVFIYKYVLGTKKYSEIREGYLWDACGRTAIVTSGQYHKGTQIVDTMDLQNEKMKVLTKNCFEHKVFGKTVYYIVYSSSVDGYWNSGTFVIKQSTLDGKNLKTISKKLNGRQPYFEGNYVMYETASGAKKKIRFK